ncbi:LysE family translocator [Desulfovibrio ferrophilus]|uniref:Lysine exporter protein LYSE/YGGA n=1 Tax=Desulfovibrio ferrophilus TaxID=241368 RepID=A0A2Z6AZQ2_9BACT|nr:LysE family translocator [Desulfovibrio ferrophilus]BBD08665.1 lysine exporter protein LYSE/YGGA [Desulfovibrio ferrophilus]
MFGIENYLLFLVAGVLLNITPGPDILYVATRSTCQGRGAGVVSALGITTGGLVHTLAAALGLSAVLMYSATAYEVVRWAGAAYLVYMGLKIILTRNGDDGVGRLSCESLTKVYRQGVLVSILNPKVALFFLSFLPQFAHASSEQFTLQILVLGLTFCCTGCIVMTTVALCFGRINAWASSRPGFRRTQSWVTGGVFLTMGLGLGIAGGRD